MDAKNVKKIKFLEAATYKQSGPDGKTDSKKTVTYKKGTTYEIDNSDGHADRWVRRGVAVEVDVAQSAGPKAIATEEPEEEKVADDKAKTAAATAPAGKK